MRIVDKKKENQMRKFRNMWNSGKISYAEYIRLVRSVQKLYGE